MAEKAKVLTTSERLERLDVPFVALIMWTALPAIAATIYAYLAPDRSVALYAGSAAAVGFVIGLGAEFSTGPVATILKFPARAITFLLRAMG